MRIEVKVPPLSESVSEATLLTWNKKVGEAVSEGENLIDIETDKVVLELPAARSGVLARIIRGDGARVVSGEVIAEIETEGAGASSAAAAVEQAEEPGHASPSVRRLAHELGVEPLPVKGSGRHGNVTKQDVERLAQQSAAPRPAMPGPSGERASQRVPMTRIRQRIAERLLQAQANAAILTTFNEVNMQPVMDLRARYREAFEQKHGVKLGFSSFFVKAAVHALKKFPIINASVDGSDIIYHSYFDIGMAIGSERGLVVPILRDADRLSFAEIERRIADYAARAKEGRLSMEELSGGTFSITNGGVFGSLFSTPIINPPQSAILGVHAIRERPVAENGQVVIRPMSYFALSYDHRIIDGREAVQFLVAIKEFLEMPGVVMLDL